MSNRIGNGPTGYPGKQLTNSVNPKKGKNGSKLLSKIEDDEFVSLLINDLGGEYCDSWLLHMLEEANRYYRGRDIEKARELYTEILELASKEDENGGLIYFNQPIYRTANSYLNQIKNGLNFFGYHPNYAPILDRNIFRQRAEDVLDSAARAYASLNEIKQTESLAQLRQQVAKIYDFEVELAKQRLDDDIRLTENKLETLDLDLDAYIEQHDYITQQLEEMMDDHERLMTASDGVEFDFFDFIAGAASVYSGGADLFSAYQAAGFTSLKDVTWSFILDNKSAIGQIAQGIGQSGVIGMLLGDEERLYDEIELLNLKHQIREFTLNSLEVAHKISVTQVELLFQSIRLESLKNRRSFIADNQNAVDRFFENTRLSLEEAKTMLPAIQGAYGELTDMVRLYIYQYAKGIEFWTHQRSEHDINYNFDNPSQLRVQLESLIRRELDFYNQLETDYHLDDYPLEIVFDEDSHPRKFERLRRTGKFSFRIRPRHIESHKRLVRLKSINFEIKRIRQDEPLLKAYLVHSGESRFKDESGQILAYVHNRQRRYYEYDIQTWERKNVELNEYAKSLVSPMSNWQLIIDQSINPGLNFSKIKKITLKINIMYLPV